MAEEAGIEAGIFDVGGVLIANTSDAIVRDITATLQIGEHAFARAWATLGPLLGAGRIEEDAFWRQVVAATGAAGRVPVPPEESLFVREYARGWLEHREVLDLVTRVRRAELKTAALSNTIAPHVAYMLRRDLFRDFDLRVFSNEVGASKPDPAIYLHTLRRLGLEDRPTAAFFVDDRQENVDAALRLGIRGLLFRDAAQLERDLAALGVPL
jgi:HAD superfamily hydrolase (TIGR01509 family)